MKYTPAEIKKQFALDTSKCRMQGTVFNLTSNLGRVVAAAHVYGEGETVAYLETIYVNATMRGRDIGTQLMLEVESKLKEKGTKFIELTSVADVILFYKNLGYVVLCDMGIHGSIMAKSLDPDYPIRVGDSMSSLVNSVRAKEK